ncbi:Prolyl 4-hydroxylase [Pleurostoma richardsiae]|uniref:Prolyl 4-hydroxylase n=1 Tax=Pleurostoma richardsiae TaxID=41990 RepID=A0AA38R506_9PEZI|nr:Prolyl 4-hydroxylase [Pleurostoma richardsiae]
MTTLQSSYKTFFGLAAGLVVLLALAVATLDPLGWIRQYSKGGSGTPTIFYLSEDPLVVYLKDFVTPQEAAHLVSLAKSEPRFAPSILWDDQGKPHMDKAYRSSTTAKLPRGDSVVRRIENRARSMPFYKAVGDFQPMVVQNYGVAGQYRDHYDWYDDAHAVGGNVASTFFVYIHANCTGGGTNFPRLTPPAEDDGTWCEFIDCDRPLEDGVTFRPVPGNAVYWENLKLRGDGEGHAKTLHSGMPVTSGNKMGLNMWTWKDA